MGNKLYLSDMNKKIGGVCGGIGEYFGIDPTIIRLVWIILAFAFGTGLLAYFVAWAIIPRRSF
ncbi:MAG: phage shock protein PspC [Clostridiales bacterium]|jgi:phage shock protein PspC (stress-responsive transcriptional regulator)|nr:phage shock protein PspC [Clostridiales bacterium]